VVADAGGNQTLEVRRDKTRTATPGVPRGGTYKVASDLADTLDKNLDDFRNKKLFDFGFSDPSKVELKTVTYVKSGDKWLAGAKNMDNTSVQNLIDKLRDLSATKFPEKGGGEPVFEARVTSGDGKRWKKSLLRSRETNISRNARTSRASMNWTQGCGRPAKAAADVKERRRPRRRRIVCCKLPCGQACSCGGFATALPTPHERPPHRPLRAHHGRRYFESGKVAEKAVFEYTSAVSLRIAISSSAPPPQVVDYLLNLSFAAEEIDYLRGLDQFRHVSPPSSITCAISASPRSLAIPKAPRCFPASRSSPYARHRRGADPGNVCALGGGVPVAVATKARARWRWPAPPVIEFGTRRAHTPEAGVLGARARTSAAAPAPVIRSPDSATASP